MPATPGVFYKPAKMNLVVSKQSARRKISS